MIDFSNFKFRCSQLSKLATGTIGATDKQLDRIDELESERDTGVNRNGNSCKWTPAKKEELEKLISTRDDASLPKTMISELKKIYRSERYDRRFEFTNKYVQKGLAQEEEAITLYMNWRNQNGKRTFFRKNEERLIGTHFQGTPDLMPVEIEGVKRGFDTKCSWSLDTFPLPDEDLIGVYEDQNQGYMELTGADEWKTVYCLVNATEHLVNNEKQKWFYALQMPGSADHEYYEEYVNKCRQVEKMLIFDYERFTSQFPYHDMEISKDEWYGNNWDIPAEERIIEMTSVRNQERIDFLKERVEISREFLVNLEKNWTNKIK